MKDTLKLSNPILINGKNVTELTHDIDEITAIQFAEADARKMRANGSKGGNLSGAVELDYGLHLYLGFAAVIAVNTDYDVSDLERIKGRDVMEVMKIGRNFILKPEDSSTESEFDERSGTTQGPSTPPPQPSKEKN